MTTAIESPVHLLQPEFIGTGDMRALYSRLHLLPTSTSADTVLIRSHIAYWAGSQTAECAIIKPSRGHSYSMKLPYYVGSGEFIVRIKDHYDHRFGVIGWHVDEE